MILIVLHLNLSRAISQLSEKVFGMTYVGLILQLAKEKIQYLLEHYFIYTTNEFMLLSFMTLYDSVSL